MNCPLTVQITDLYLQWCIKSLVEGGHQVGSDGARNGDWVRGNGQLLNHKGLFAWSAAVLPLKCTQVQRFQALFLDGEKKRL